MTIGRLEATETESTPEQKRQMDKHCFDQLATVGRRVQESKQSSQSEPFELSMGMSGDFEVAVRLEQCFFLVKSNAGGVSQNIFLM